MGIEKIQSPPHISHGVGIAAEPLPMLATLLCTTSDLLIAGIIPLFPGVIVNFQPSMSFALVIWRDAALTVPYPGIIPAELSYSMVTLPLMGSELTTGWQLM